MNLRFKWILLRGLGRGHGHWGSFAEKVQRAYPEDKFYFVDLPGNGSLNFEESPLQIHRYVSSLEQQLIKADFFHHGGTTIGIGLSLGGMVMTEWARIHHQRFEKIFLINSSAANFSYPWERISWLVLSTSLKQIGTSNIEVFETNSLLVTTSLTKEQLQNEFRNDLLHNTAFTEKFPITVKNIIRQTIAAARYTFPLKSPVPAVILVGSKDRFVRPACSYAIQKTWNCKMNVHPTAGHDIAFEDPNWVIQTIGLHRN